MASYSLRVIKNSSYTQLDPTTLWLKEEFGARAFFPDEHNHFHIPADEVYGLVVEGATVQRNPTAAVPVCAPGSSLQSASQPSGAPVHKPIFSGKKGQSTNVKIIQATYKKTSARPEFTPTNQAFITVSEANANVVYLTDAIRRKWGDDFVLVTGDGLRLEDSSGTQGRHSEVAGEIRRCSSTTAVAERKGQVLGFLG